MITYNREIKIFLFINLHFGYLDTIDQCIIALSIFIKNIKYCQYQIIIVLSAPRFQSQSFTNVFKVNTIGFLQLGLQCYANDEVEGLWFAQASNQLRNCDFQPNPLMENAR